MGLRLVPTKVAMFQQMEDGKLETASEILSFSDKMEERLDVFKIMFRISFFFAAIMMLSISPLLKHFPGFALFPALIAAAGCFIVFLYKRQKHDIEKAVEQRFNLVSKKHHLDKIKKVVSQ